MSGRFCRQEIVPLSVLRTVQKWYERKGDAMKILFHGDHEFTRDAEELVIRRCEYAFDRFENSIREIRVTARDENGPRGGDDIHCIIHVTMTRMADVIVHEKATSFEIAIGEAVDRASYQVSRRLDRYSDAVRRVAVAH